MSSAGPMLAGGGADDDEREQFERKSGASAPARSGPKGLRAFQRSSTRGTPYARGGSRAPPRRGPGDAQSTTRKKAAAGRQTRDFSSPGVRDRFKANLTRIRDKGADLTPSGTPRTTNISAGATKITTTNIRGSSGGDPGLVKRVTRAMGRQSGKGGSPIPPGPPGSTTIQTIVPNVTLPKIELPELPEFPKLEAPDLSGLRNTLLLGIVAIFGAVLVFGAVSSAAEGAGKGAVS